MKLILIMSKNMNDKAIEWERLKTLESDMNYCQGCWIEQEVMFWYEDESYTK